jgi:basic membrane lipoprotein Med (substrate-binding protein (PBP1-ABC) superfamily)
MESMTESSFVSFIIQPDTLDDLRGFLFGVAAFAKKIGKLNVVVVL